MLETRWMDMHVAPLPGGLDRVPMFVSNSPEVITQAGVMLATMSPPAGASGLPFLCQAPLQGPLQVFLHHIAKGDGGPDRRLHVAFLAHNPGRQTVRLRLRGGGSFLSQPDAPFKPLPAVVEDPQGQVFAGPGDRLAVTGLMGRSNLAPQAFSIQAGAYALVWQAPIPVDVPIPPPINGRSTLFAVDSDGPLHYAATAVYAPRHADGIQVAPALRDHLALLAKGQAAGPREPAPPAYEATGPLPKPFRYGRVAGIAEGAHWHGEASLQAPAPGQSLAWPVATARANSWGTGQVQSGAMLARVGDTAWGNHGNYGVAYRLRLHLEAKPQAQKVGLALGHPGAVVGTGAAARVSFLLPPAPSVTWRGPVMVRVRDPRGQISQSLHHLVLRSGQAPERFKSLSLAPHQGLDVELRWLYPPDATPAQLLVLEGLAP